MTIQITTLKNGMRVATDTMPHAKTVSIQLCVDIGSRYEQPELSGISHFLEHMAFKGTKKRSARDIAQAFDAIGGHFNAYTSREHTVYYSKILKDNLSVAIDILSDIIQNSVFDTEEIERERNVVLQEIAQTNDTPDDLIFDHYQETAYPSQPLGRSILGTEAHVMQFNRNQLIEYVNQYYHGPRIVAVAAGNIEHDDFVKQIEQAFWHLPGGSDITLQPCHYKGGQHRKERDLEQVHLIIGFEGMPYMNDEIYTLQLLSTVFGGGMSSRLFQEVREKHGLVYSVYSFTSSYNDTGTFGIYAGTGEEHLPKLIPIICDEIHKMIDKVTQEELNLAKTQVRAGLLMGQESTHSRAEDLGRHILCFNRPISLEEIMENIDAVTPQAIQKMMEKVIRQSPPTLAAIGKIGKIEAYETLVGRL